MSQPETTALEVVAIHSGEVVHTVNTQGQGYRSVERILRGMLTQTDTERFFIREVSA